MITHLNGKLVEKNPTYVIIEANGVGYWVNISLNTFSQLPNEESILLYTYLSVKEDSHTLYGFSTKTERALFKMLISVSGVGPGTARTMLSSMTTNEIQQAIASGDVATIQSVKGIGVKTAQRVLVDLRDKISKTYAVDEVSASSNNTNKNEALSALEVLGFPKKQAEKVLDKIILADSLLSVEQLIKQALKNL